MLVSGSTGKMRINKRFVKNIHRRYAMSKKEILYSLFKNGYSIEEFEGD